MIKISDYEAIGPFFSADELEKRSGVYVIMTSPDRNMDPLTVIDVGESNDVNERVSNHDRSSCWQQANIGELVVAVIYTLNQDQQGRKLIEQELRDHYQPCCGER